jgi:glycerophosphoryl diester phosphodiesterase
VELGADGVEFDVQRSMDGVPVVIHDPTLDRTTNGAGAVSAQPWAALSALSAGPGEPLRQLREVAEWAATSGAWLNVELKSAGVESATLQALERAGVLGRSLLSSFLPDAVAEVGRLLPGARRALLSECWDAGVAARARSSGAGGVCIHRSAATREVFDQLRGAGLFAVVWTVDETAEIRALVRQGVWAIITNRPEVAVAARQAADL